MQPNTKAIAQKLGKAKLYIADVGSTGGPEDHWKALVPFCHFYTFDPDPRAKKWQIESTNFQMGLWSSKCSKTLNLMAFPEASSLYKMNHDVLSGFANDGCHNQVGTTEIELDSLDALLKDKPLDFLKVDTEGAELEILKGAKSLLKKHCLGVQLEVAFCQRHEGAPLFSEIDHEMRQNEFELFHIDREHWLRDNRVSYLDSKPQLIWGNALYLLPNKIFFKRLEAAEDKSSLFIKYLLILVSYGLYDYAYYLCEKAEGIVESSLLDFLKKELNYSFSTTKAIATMLPSIALSLLKYSTRISKQKRKRAKRHLMRGLRKLGAALYVVTRSDFAFYD